MQDIDFDEIDRAVNSITRPDPKTNVPEPALPVNPADVTPTLAEPAPLTPVIPSPAVRRSSGRFMDVVHPSSDMRPETNARPSAPFATSFHREEVPARVEVAAQPEPVAAPSTAFHWPDPLDAAKPVDEPLPEATPEIVEEIQPAVEETAPEVTEEAPAAFEPEELIEEDDDEEAAPLESPFLTDAKVEKRPLGAFSGADADLPLLEDPIPFSTNLVAPQPVVVSEAETVEVEEPAHEEHEATPDEFHPDLLALDGHMQDEPLLEATNPPDPEPIAVVDEVPTGPTSITQQYKEQPSSAAESTGSIYDTEAYHQPLTHTPKKHSGALVVVWIAALILVGGGIGAGIYFVVLPMLG